MFNIYVVLINEMGRSSGQALDQHWYRFPEINAFINVFIQIFMYNSVKFIIMCQLSMIIYYLLFCLLL